MAPYRGEERRSVKRTPLTTFCPAEFAFEGRKYKAMMIDLSEKGARFRMEEYSQHCDLNVGDEVQFEVRTPYGVSLCTGGIVWAKHIDEHFTWGIRFTKVSSDEKDPLRCFMESVF